MMAWCAVAALVAATVYAPLFHVHTDDGEAPLVHAHFPELETAEDEAVVHMEAPHPHALARSIDVLITLAAQSVQLDAVVQSSFLTLPDLETSSGFVPDASPRAHAPPAVESFIPRAPPA